MITLEEWINDNVFSKNGTGFFSLEYGGTLRNSQDLDSEIVSNMDSGTFTETEILFTIEKELLFLRMKLKKYHDFPVVECLPYLENHGRQASMRISRLKTLDLSLPLPSQKKILGNLAGTKVAVRYNIGSYGITSDFTGQIRELWTHPGHNEITMQCSEGRSSSAFLPFFGLDLDQMNGLSVGIGWCGNWSADIWIPVSGTDWNVSEFCNIALGMSNAEFKVLPGEKLRQVGWLIHFRNEKDIRCAQNEFRRFMTLHHAPHDSKGALLLPPVSLMTWGGMPTQEMLARIDAVRVHSIPFDAFWVDAGWFGFEGPCPHFLDPDKTAPSNWQEKVGNWNENRSIHPDGLRKIRDAAREAGMKFILWIEPERVSRNSRLALLQEHPEFFVDNGTRFLMFNLGNPDAAEWMFGHLKDIILNLGVDIYREDFNYNTIPYWKILDGQDRIGIAEMKYVEAHYGLWEKLRREFPDMPIDNCAGGGRRLDFMSLTHSWPLCQSDYSCFPNCQSEFLQTENFYLSDWLPLHAGFSWYCGRNSYDFYSALGTGFADKKWSYDSIRPDDSTDWVKMSEHILHAKKIRDILAYGDFYPLTRHPENSENHCAWQGHLPEQDCGFVLAFRRRETLSDTLLLIPGGLEPGGGYELTFPDGRILTVKGEELLKNGLSLRFSELPESMLLFYRRIHS